MRNAIAFISLMIFAAIAGSALRAFENGNPFPAIGIAGIGVTVAVTVVAIRFRNWLDRRALNS